MTPTFPLRRINWSDQILKAPNPVLLQKSLPVTPNFYYPLILEQMQNAMLDAEGMGLSAIQIGIALRLFIFVPTGRDISEIRICMNPMITWQSKLELSPWAEGCLSIPGYTQHKMRSMTVKLRYEDVHLERVFLETFHGLDAVCVQHEMDHLEGKLINAS